ncbi:MAG: ATP-binding protein [Pseudomonadota bacterium]
MTRDLSLSWRVGLIVVVALMAGWLGLIAASYLSAGLGQATGLPEPMRLAALADLLEEASVEERDKVLAAVRTPQLAIWMEPEPLTASRLPAVRPLDAAMLESYRAALAERTLAVAAMEGTHLVGGGFASAFSAVEFRIGLAGDRTLVVTSESPFAVAPLGLPVGFPAGLAGVLIALVTLILLHREFRPLSRLAAVVDGLDPGSGAPSLPTIRARSPEVKALVAAFERLQARIETLMRARLALVGGIQHDLRSFATRLRLRVDKIADPVDRDRAAAEIADMIALMDDALLASRAGASELDEELVEIAPLIGAEITDREAAGAMIEFALGDPANAEGAVVLGDRLALRRIVANLIDNALKYGARARVALALDGPNIVLNIDDDGPGISPGQRVLLLEPFTRAEPSRARRTGGAGLGLAVVQSLTQAHGGSVDIRDAPLGGARVVVTLPLFPTGAGS